LRISPKRTAMHYKETALWVVTSMRTLNWSHIIQATSDYFIFTNFLLYKTTNMKKLLVSTRPTHFHVRLETFVTICDSEYWRRTGGLSLSYIICHSNQVHQKAVTYVVSWWR
jgi:hypothetical protein